VQKEKKKKRGLTHWIARDIAGVQITGIGAGEEAGMPGAGD
jgi:hypothetical protein